MRKDGALTPSSLTDNALECEVADKDISIVYRTFKYRLLPTRSQHKKLEEICESQRQLYNAALEERIDCYRKTGKGRSYNDQCKSVTKLREDDEYSSVPTNVQRWTLKRLDSAYKDFFRRGNGFPRFRSYNRWKSFGFAEFSGIRLNGNILQFNGMGGLRVHFHRLLQGEIKTCAFRRDTKGWSVCFRCAIPLKKRQHTGLPIGIDVGLNYFATLSSGEHIPNPRIARRHEKELRRRQRAFARCKKGSNRRQKIKDNLKRVYQKVGNARLDFLHKQSSILTKQYRAIIVEDLKIKNMVKNPALAGPIFDAGWAMFINFLSYKAEEAGGEVIKVNPRNTSQVCSGCGDIVRKKLKERIHSCPSCSLVLDRDHNAALNILSRGGTASWLANVAECRKRPAGNISVAI